MRSVVVQLLQSPSVIQCPKTHQTFLPSRWLPASATASHEKKPHVENRSEIISTTSPPQERDTLPSISRDREGELPEGAIYFSMAWMGRRGCLLGISYLIRFAVVRKSWSTDREQKPSKEEHDTKRHRTEHKSQSSEPFSSPYPISMHSSSDVCPSSNYQSRV